MLTEDAVQIAPRELLEEATIQKRCKDERMSTLDHIDLSLKLTRAQEAKRLSKAQARLLYLRLVLGGIFDGSGRLGPPVCLVFEGWDASGKGGAIKRDKLPGWGGMTILDRSWYGRVLVERVEGYATEEQWRRAYAEIRAFERTLADEGMLILKFWIHISDEEQLARFKARQTDPLKKWKLTDEDWRNREKRPQYEEAVIEMLERTDTSFAPWILVEGNDKRYARVKVIETVIEHIEKALERAGIEIPPETPGD